MSQTGSSMLAWYRDGIGVVVREAYSQPCCSLYLPAYPGVTMPAIMSRATGRFSEDSLWWLMDRLCKIVGLDHDKFAPQVQKAIAAAEREIEAIAGKGEAEAAVAAPAEKQRILAKVVADCAAIAENFTKEQYAAIVKELNGLGVTEITGGRADFLKKYCEVTGMKLL